MSIELADVSQAAIKRAALSGVIVYRLAGDVMLIDSKQARQQLTAARDIVNTLSAPVRAAQKPDNQDKAVAA
jgi:hypothetical protein